MSVSDIDLIQAWRQVLTLSKLEAGQTIDAIGDVTITHEIRDGEEFTVIRGNTQGDNAADFELSLHGRHNLTINDFLGVS